MPSTVDSAAVAGILDLLRCQGVWYHSVRYGFLFGPTRSTLDYDMPTKAEFEAAASIAQSKFASLSLNTTGWFDTSHFVLSHQCYFYSLTPLNPPTTD